MKSPILKFLSDTEKETLKTKLEVGVEISYFSPPVVGKAPVTFLGVSAEQPPSWKNAGNNSATQGLEIPLGHRFPAHAL